MRYQVHPPSLLSDLRWHFERSGFAVQVLSTVAIAVERPDAPSEAQGRREIGLHARLWEAMHPEARLTCRPLECCRAI